mgnify:FL=1
MLQMLSSSFIRKIASLLLVLCFTLPLSQCSKFTENGEASSIAYFSGVNNISDAISDTSTREAHEIVTLIACTVLIFFFPVTILKVSRIIQSTSTIAVFVLTIYPLWFWVFIGTPQFGGVLSLICWFTLLCVSIVDLFKHWQHNKTLQAPASQAGTSGSDAASGP